VHDVDWNWATRSVGGGGSGDPEQRGN
jgi:hypothetical protein